MGDNHATLSPAMDIQFAYNLERMVYYMCGEDCAKVCLLMEEVEKQYRQTPGATGVVLDEVLLEKIQAFFSSCSVTDEETLQTIRDMKEGHDYALCPHSAIGVCAATKHFAELSGCAPMICVLTAHPSKFEETFTRATSRPPPQLARYPVDVLHTLPTKYEVLAKNVGDNWRREWIDTLKGAVLARSRTV